jgi:thiosulfate dehydrogenase [quinone] large subunit
MAGMKTRDVALAAAIVVGFIIFQIGADWREGAGALVALLGLLVVLGAVGTFIYDNTVTNRVDAGGATEVPAPALSRFLFHDTRAAPLWLAVRLYVGAAWLEAGWHKLTGTGWVDGGAALKGFWTTAVAVDPKSGTGPITYDWYRDFLQYMLDHGWYTWMGKLIPIGELLVGIGIVLGGLVGIAAFFGALLNMSFMLAGSASTNPILFSLAILLVLAWQVAGFWGLDRFILPLLGAPWAPGQVFRRGQPAGTTTA